MTEEERTIQIRKFLKRVGVESHEAINAALDAASGSPSGGTLGVRMALTLDGNEANARVFETTIGAS